MEVGQESSRWEQGNEYLSQEQLNSLPDVIDEEVTSIITIEDVMEKLLQFNAVVRPITSFVFLISCR